MKNRKHFRLRRMAGITMVESLVALVVVSVGMLGIAGLYLASLKAGRTASLRVQAINLVSDMADRIRANKHGTTAYGSADYDGGPEAHECAKATCTADEIAENDLNSWFATIDDSLRSLGAVGSVTYVDPGAPDVPRYVVAISWREAGEDQDSTIAATVQL
jgi:type IV pilus assembly protein PilV